MLLGLFENHFAPLAPSPDSNTSLENTVRLPGRYRWTAILLSALLFASFHQWHHWPALTVLAVVLGYCYERHGNLWICIIIHSLFNLMSIMMTLLAPSS